MMHLNLEYVSIGLRIAATAGTVVTWKLCGWFINRVCVRDRVENRRRIFNWLILLIWKCGARNVTADRLVQTGTTGSPVMERRITVTDTPWCPFGP